MTLLISRGFNGVSDPDAAAYVAAVEAADGQLLENAVGKAINAFVIGCKNDGIWTAIKASCILAGARTLNGALVPLVGAAPTNVGPFVSGDYNRKTGLVGDGSTKYLNSNRNNNADPQDSKHLSCYASTTGTAILNDPSPSYIGQALATGSSHVSVSSSTSGSTKLACRVNGPGIDNIDSNTAGFIACNRSSSTGFFVRANAATSAQQLSTSATPASSNLLIFDGIAKNNARIAFYSIGESLNLALLDARVTTLINAFAAAIP